MCGICGFFEYKKTAREFPEKSALSRMCTAMSHRGPDDRGEYYSRETGVALGHLRLSIIDLSSAGHQPMTDFDQRLRIVYNGEIYNFKELADDLRKRGHRFQSSSDTEVILKSYREWGEECLNKFRGFWALAIWNEKQKKLILTSDRIGKKPLYFADLGGTLIFASEIKGLLASNLLNKDIDYDGLHHYIALVSVTARHPMLTPVQ